MIRIPAHLERRLAELYPRLREREEFVADLLEEELDKAEFPGASGAPDQVGGTLHLFSDGGSRGNPGQAAIGVILEDPTRGETLKEYAECIGIETNNVAEYRALIEGLKLAQHYQPNRLICHLDSELVVKQLNGEYRVKMPTLEPLFDEVRELSMALPDVIFKHIPRSDNYRADALVNKALDAQGRSAPRHTMPPHRPYPPPSQRSMRF